MTNPNLKRGSASIVDMSVRERFAADMLAALITAGFAPSVVPVTDQRRQSLAKEACRWVDALLVGLADTNQTKLVVEPARKTEEQLLRAIQDCPLSGTAWRHIRSGDKVYIDRAVIIEATAEPGVCYRHGWVVFVRPLKEFRERFVPLVENGGPGKPRNVAPPMSLDQAADKDHLTVCEPPC